ncbi:response regulator [Leptolyngbyaceae cyanobacterium CCMR0082]|uniref:histidine kinase n=1 Tax=Adonisia turfae CCMR0082 TaxID=2304604 RepID=A0A6M0S8U5_9CYAN|nr:response regulator [Adonisia turfae]NEZ64897.1 response regulator [Adonisia turfae CCMR0082]
MSDTDSILEFAETLIHKKTDTFCSELQRQILIAALQGERKTYDQIAEECGYSAKYVKQDVAPKLWQLISQSLDQKVTKANVRGLLEQAMRSAAPAPKPVTAPIAADAAAAAVLPVTPATTAPTAVPSVKPLSGSTILLVDDQPKNLRLLSDLLEEQGYEVQQAINGTVALQAVSLEQPDLILLDIHMPDMDGYTVCQQIKANPTTQEIPIIFVSALDEAWDKVKAFSAGGSDYISKPFKVVEVLARVENQLKVQQLQHQLKAQNAQLQQAIQELQRLAALDELTQVASRRRFDAYLLQCWQQAVQSQTSLSLMLAQVDNFNFYGEGGTPTAGDQCLTQVAQVLKQTIQGSNDLVGRYGTLVFAVVLPNTTIAEKMAQKLLQAVEKIEQTLSIGIITAQPTADMGLEAFLEGCDLALQQAKQSGGNGINIVSL